MAEIEITLPTVQFGNVKIRGTAEEWGLDTISDAPDVGVWAAVYLNLFSQGFKKGAAMDVDAHLGASKSEVDQVIDETLANAQKLVQDGLGATEVAGDESTTKPWDAPAEATEPKPWETKSEAPKPVVDSDW